MVADLSARSRGHRGRRPRQLAAKTSIGRLVTADEVAAVVAFLASPRGVALNGDPVSASGGDIGAIYY